MRHTVLTLKFVYTFPTPKLTFDHPPHCTAPSVTLPPTINYSSNFCAMSLNTPISQQLSSNRNKNDELSPEQRALVLGDVDAGMKKTDIAAKHNISRQAVYNTINRYNETGDLVSRPRAGRPQALNRAEKRAILRIVRRNPRCRYAALRAKCTTATLASYNAIYRHLKKHYIIA